MGKNIQAAGCNGAITVHIRMENTTYIPTVLVSREAFSVYYMKIKQNPSLHCVQSTNVSTTPLTGKTFIFDNFDKKIGPYFLRN